MSDAAAELGDITARLERAAERLRAGETSSEEAAELLEECARTAGEAAAELERQSRAVESPPPGQEPLL